MPQLLGVKGAWLVVAALLALGLSGCSGSTAVHLRDYRFDPSETKVAVGETLKFISDGPSQHTVTIHDPQGHTVLDRELGPGESVDYTFATAGTFHVFCKIHKDMQLTVTVQ